MATGCPRPRLVYSPVANTFPRITMEETLDEILDRAFSPERVVKEFFAYKYAKWDRLKHPVTINIPMGADGVTFESFQRQLPRHATNISQRVRDDRYTFYPFREVDKPKDNSKPLAVDNKRTLGVATIRDALVQGILYKDVLYEPIEAIFRPLDVAGPVSFAYRRGKSAPLAARVIHEYTQQGYLHVLDADLSKYFDSIPHAALLDRLARAIGGDASKTFRLLRRYVRTDRVAHNSYRNSRRRGRRVGVRIFHNRKPRRRQPKLDRGVPQGGTLSGMLANLYLHDFDLWVVDELAKRFDIKYVRYADDFVIMAKSSSVLPQICDEVANLLSSTQFELHLNRAKTECRYIPKDGLDFVGFHFDGRKISVRQKNIERFKERIENEIFARLPEDYNANATVRWLIKRINAKVKGLSSEQECPWCRCRRVGPPRSWMAFFSVSTDFDQLRDLDRWIRVRIYACIYQQFQKRIKRKHLTGDAGLRLVSLVSEAKRTRNVRLKPCLCDIDARNGAIWPYAEDLFQGKDFFTLARNCRFTVQQITEDGLLARVAGKRCVIPRTDLECLWKRLMNGETVARSEMDEDGIRNTSQLTTLISKLPGVHVELYPIRLSLRRHLSREFLRPVETDDDVEFV